MLQKLSNYLICVNAGMYSLPSGVFLFMGYSKTDEQSMHHFTNLNVSKHLLTAIQRVLQQSETWVDPVRFLLNFQSSICIQWIKMLLMVIDWLNRAGIRVPDLHSRPNRRERHSSNPTGRSGLSTSQRVHHTRHAPQRKGPFRVNHWKRLNSIKWNIRPELTSLHNTNHSR